MILLNVTYNMKEGKLAADFLNELESSGLAPYFRTEKGNYCYRYFCPADGANQLFLQEKWEDGECLEAHTKTENFAKIGMIKEQYVESMELLKAEINA